MNRSNSWSALWAICAAAAALWAHPAVAETREACRVRCDDTALRRMTRNDEYYAKKFEHCAGLKHEDAKEECVARVVEIHDERQRTIKADKVICKDNCPECFE